MSNVDPTPASPPPYDPPPSHGVVSGSNAEDRTLALLTHLSGILFGFVVPLIMWLVHKDRSDKDFLNDHAKEALNFNITLLIVYAGLFVLTIITLGLASPLYFLVWVVSIVFFIIAGMKANNNEMYRYPFALRLIK